MAANDTKKDVSATSRVYNLLASAAEDYSGAPFIASVSRRSCGAEPGAAAVVPIDESRKELQRGSIYPTESADKQLTRLLSILD